MQTAQTQIKVNVPVIMMEYLESKADKFGMTIAGYLKHLILNDIKDLDYPTFQASEQTEKAYKKAVEEYNAGKVIRAKNINKFFEEL